MNSAELNAILREAETQQSWAEYAVFVRGEANSSDEQFNEAIRCLYEANETVHRVANQLAIRYDVEFFGGL